MKLSTFIMVLIAVVLLLSPAYAKEWRYEKTGFVFSIPDDWKTAWTEERGCFSSWDPEGVMEFDFFAPKTIQEIDNQEEALLHIIDEVDDWWLAEIQIGKPQKSTINGMDVLVVEGAGKSKNQSFAGWEEGEKVAFIAAIYKKDGKFFMIVGYAPDSELDTEEGGYIDARYDDLFLKIVRSIDIKEVVEKE